MGVDVTPTGQTTCSLGRDGGRCLVTPMGQMTGSGGGWRMGVGERHYSYRSYSYRSDNWQSEEDVLVLLMSDDWQGGRGGGHRVTSADR